MAPDKTSMHAISRRGTSRNGTSVGWFGFVVLALCVYFSWQSIRFSGQSVGFSGQSTGFSGQSTGAPDPPMAVEGGGSDGVMQRGRVVTVADGDSLAVLVGQSGGRRKTRIRLEGIDCPEFGQPFHRRAKRFLSDLCLGKDVDFQPVDRDRYGRLVARVYVGERDLRLELLRAGLAWHFVRYNTQAELAAAEAYARSRRIGLWQDDAPVAPWDWRQDHAERSALRRRE